MNKLIKEAILVKAKKLGITPGFLFYAIDVLSKNPKAKEEAFLKKYFAALVQEHKEIAEKQLQSKNKHEKEKGESALRNLEKHLYSIAEMENFETARISLLMPEGEPVRKIHYMIWDQVTDELFHIRQKHGTELGESDVLQIISNLCPLQIEQYKTNGGMLEVNGNVK
jgi:hypothetical protein